MGDVGVVRRSEEDARFAALRAEALNILALARDQVLRARDETSLRAALPWNAAIKTGGPR